MWKIFSFISLLQWSLCFLKCVAHSSDETQLFLFIFLSGLSDVFLGADRLMTAAHTAELWKLAPNVSVL